MVPPLLPVQFGLPGAMELVVIVIIFGLLALPIVLLVLGFLYLRRRRRTSKELEDRIEELEAQIEDLEQDVERRE